MDRNDSSAVRTEQPDRHAGCQPNIGMHILTSAICRFELFLLGDGEKKVTEEVDTRVPHASVFTFKKEDHTLGNLISSRLPQNPHVTFSGYKVPHPLVSEFILRVQTDGTLTARAAVIQTCKDAVRDLDILSREFTKEYELRKMVGNGAKADDKNDNAK